MARRRLRRRLALEFTLIAAAIHALVALGTVLLRDRYYDRLFNGDLRERAGLSGKGTAGRAESFRIFRALISSPQSSVSGATYALATFIRSTFRSVSPRLVH